MRRTLLAAVVTGTALVAGPATAGAAPIDPAPEGAAGVGGVTGPTVVAVGDIACPPGQRVTAERCQQARTATLAKSYDPLRVLGLGDLQYDSGTLRAFRNSYADSWGSLKAITRPVPGNHEYRTRRAGGYYSYFANQQPGAPGYYAFDIGTWRLYALNSNCTKIDCGRQARWLAANMSNHPRRCSAIFMHHPRFSSGGEHGSSLVSRRFWRVAFRRHTDIALSGHDHDYERFYALTPSGEPSAHGIRQFVSGAGGKSLYRFGRIVRGSLVRDNHAPGVLALTLGAGEYGFEYRTVDGRVVDSGARSCH